MLADERERLLIALFGLDSLLNRQAGGFFAAWEPRAEDQALYESLDCQVLSSTLLELRSAPTEQQVKLAELFNDISDFIVEHPVLTGTSRISPASDLKSVMLRQATPSTVNGNVLLAVIGKDITVEDFLEPRFFIQEEGSRAGHLLFLVLKLLQQWEQGLATFESSTGTNMTSMFPFYEVRSHPVAKAHSLRGLARLSRALPNAHGTHQLERMVRLIEMNWILNTNTTPAGEGDTGHRDDADTGRKRKAWVPSVIWRPHGRFRRVKAAPLLGRNAFASVHRPVDLLGGPKRAAKRQEYTDRPSSRLVSKIRAFSILQPHPGIVELLNDLLDTAQGRELRLSTAKNLTHQILVVVTHIHENDVVHLDIKPDNILLSDSGAVKISDFGLAVEAGTGQDMRTAGTVGYTAPECLMGFRRPTFQNDPRAVHARHPPLHMPS
ncbi:hypothetical protein CF336_g6725 [Tilletia laevis]|nr:hypothetical protein CF336_g6725 [Tilletia laevis]